MSLRHPKCVYIWEIEIRENGKLYEEKDKKKWVLN